MLLFIQFQNLKFYARWFPIFLFLILVNTAFSQVITTVAGSGYNGSTGNGGLAVNAGLPYPSGVCTDPAGNLYVTGTNSVRKIAAGTGLITIFAGNGTYATSGDGAAAINASLKFPVSVCSDNAGNIYIAEYGGHCIRKVTTSGIITTVAGNGSAGYSGDGGAAIAASINQPWGVTADASGNLFIADNKNYRIRKVAVATGVITTVAGNGTASFSGDGGLSVNAGIAASTSIIATQNGDVYFTEAHSGISCRVRKIAVGTSIITTVAGTSSYGYSGDGGSALTANLFDPSGLAVAATGDLYISTYDDSRIRKVNAATGIITTFAGTGNSGFSGDGGTPTSAMLNLPMGLALDAAGNLYVADNTNHRVRKIGAAPVCPSPTITISTPSTLNCFSLDKTFTAITTGPATSVFFQWKKNGVNFGTSNSIQGIPCTVNDIITCSLTQINSCGTSVTVTSNSITIQSNPGYNFPPEVTIAVTQQTICAGTSVTFNATNVSASSVLSWQWLVNGTAAGTNNPAFSTSTLKDGDKVECIMTVPMCNSNPGATTKDYSNPIVMKVDPVLNPSVSIAASANSICRGSAVTFTATAAQGGNTPSYQWKLNGNNVGSNNASYTTNTLLNGDVITCEFNVDATAQCVDNRRVVSNSLNTTVQDVVAPSVQVTASETEVCAGASVTFTAVAGNAGAAPAYQWQINGSNAGSNSPQLITATLADGDKIICIVSAANTVCATAATSNSIAIRVYPLPLIQFNPSSILINSGGQAQLNAMVQGNIVSHQWTPAILLADPTSLTPFTTPLAATTSYQLLVQTAAGCEGKETIVVTVYNKLYMANSFTPNGDGKNDVFRIPVGSPIKLKEFSVFDRWGNKVFSTTDVNKGWDGKNKGAYLTTNTFVYVIRGQDDKGDVFLKGTVLLIK